ncbi:FAD-dependent oxidoreductase [Desulfoscipio gibsoniae]|nr:FAD-dependent oxidoreductase [Desulfoscipio gibsoniae]
MSSNKKIAMLALLAGLAVIALAYAAINSIINRDTGNEYLPPPRSVGDAYDLIVVGGDPEGVAAAVSGARNGLDVLLVDTRPELGGLMTRGWLNSIDMNYGPGGEILNKGIFQEFYDLVEGDSFDVQTAVRAFNRLVNAEEKLTVLLNADSVIPVVKDVKNEPPGGRVVTGIRLVYGGVTREIIARNVIDATQDGDMAALAGVPFSLGQEDIGRQSSLMAATLVFRLENVSWLDWWKIRFYLTFTDARKSTGANRHSAWGFYDQTALYKPSTDRLFLRGLNIGRQNDGSLLINALLIYGVDPLDPGSREEAREIAVKELPAIVEFLNKKVSGLSKAGLGGVAPELYVRESRHIYGEYRLTLDDVLENRDFDDRIAFGSYPVDMQPTDPGIPGIIIGAPQQYAVPFRCLVPQQVDGLLVVGRTASFDSLAHGSARTVPVGMAAGQAAGAAAALVAEHHLTFRELAANRQLIAELQRRLEEQGVELEPFHIDNELAGHEAYAGLKFIRGLGLASGGYNNDYRLDQDIAEQRYINILYQVIKQSVLDISELPSLYPEGNIFNLHDAGYMLVKFLGLDLSKQASLDYLAEKGIFTGQEDYWRDYMDPEKPLSHGAAYLLMKEFVEMLQDKRR